MDYFTVKYDIDCPAGVDSAVLDDSIMQKGRPATAGSRILEGFISPIDATVVTRLEAAGVHILGRTKSSEFGTAGLFAPIPQNNSEFISGAVSAVADGAATFALCSDYTGAVGREAARRGVCYIRPTYGTVSRYGLIPAVASMDQIGIVCKTPADGFRALSIIAGHDAKDGAMFGDCELSDGESKIENGKLKMGEGSCGCQGHVDVGRDEFDSSGLRVGVPVNVLARVPDASLTMSFLNDFEAVDFELKYYDVFAQVMQILCCAELSSSISRYDGIKFGYRADSYTDLQELYTKSRTQALGLGAKIAAIVGAMVLSQANYEMYYDKAMRIRRLIKESLEFDKYDAIIMPNGAEFGIDNAALPMLCGLPAITIPGFGGITLIADAQCENRLFSILEAVSL